MLERFDGAARDVFVLAGNLAAERRREQLGEGGVVRGVQITVADVRRAYRLLVDAGGWSGATSAAVNRRLDRLPVKGSIGTAELREVFRGR